MAAPIHVGLLGAEGRMGRAILRALTEHDDAKLACAVTSPTSANLGQVLSDNDVTLTCDIRQALEICDVMIDFSSPQAAIDAALAMHATRCHTLVTGTTGYTETEENALLKASESITLLRSGNFSLGVNLLEALVEKAAQKLGTDWDIEISDKHHRHKVDAPSGTALMLGEAAARGRKTNLKDKAVLSRHGRTAARVPGQIGFSAMRGGGIVGQHDVHFAHELEMITLSHEALDRSVFAHGAVTAALWAVRQPKGLYNMKHVLGL